MSVIFIRIGWLSVILGRWRLLFGNCPRCNSDAPAVYSCTICDQVIDEDSGQLCQNYRQQFPPTPATKALWWSKWARYAERS